MSDGKSKPAVIAPSFTHKDVANRVFHFYTAQHVSLATWAFYLFDESYASQRELKNKVGTIWFGSLYDALEGEIRLLPAVQAAAKAIGRDRLIYYADKISEMCLSIRQLISKYTKAEQIYLYDRRCQMVHTWGANIFNPIVQIKYVDSEVYKRERVAFDDYHALIRPLYESAPVDEVVWRLLSPLWERKEPFMIGLIDLMFDDQKRNQLQREIFEGVD